MDPTPLSDQSIEEIVAKIDNAAYSRPELSAMAILAARLTLELTGGVRELSGNVFIAKKQLVERLDALTTEIKSAQIEMAKSSAEASQQTKSLVRWTRTLVWATIAYTVITGGLLLVALAKT